MADEEKGTRIISTSLLPHRCEEGCPRNPEVAYLPLDVINRDSYHGEDDTEEREADPSNKRAAPRSGPL
jgi:hypothetical protein